MILLPQISGSFRLAANELADGMRPFNKANKMNNKKQKKPVSPKQLAANRANSQRSPGPQTSAGKQRSSQNSYKHGFFALRLFPNSQLLAQDGADYDRIYAAYWNHYAPVGDLEKLGVEKIAVESLRLARLLGHEQKPLAWGTPFELRSIDKIVRYESNVSRQLEKAIEQLERLQEARQMESYQFEPSDLESDDAISNPDVATEGSSESPEELKTEQPQPISTPATAPQHFETSVKQEVAQMDGEPSNRPAETAPSNPPPPENCVTKAGVQTLTKIIDQAMSPTPAEERKSSLGSGENYRKGPTNWARFIETEEDEEIVQSVKYGRDLDLQE
jgi:hypothetical protein